MPTWKRRASATARCFIHHPGGWAVKDTECQEKMGIVEHHAAALYSEGEHHKWRMASLPGSDFLRLQILRALVAFNGRLLAIEAARRNGIDPDQPPLRSDARPRDPQRPE